MGRHLSRRSKPEHVLPQASEEITSLTNVATFSMKNVRRGTVLKERTNSTSMYGEATKDGSASLNLLGLSMGNETVSVDPRRMRRYVAAEEALARQFQRCQAETSPLELQIRALKEATSMLSSHAQDAREQAERLRGLLVDRDMDPEAFESLKRERWLQEHRQGVADEENRVVQQQLTILSNPTSQSAGIGKPCERNEEARRRQNLLMFLDSSAKRPSVRIRKTTSVLFQRPQKRRTMDRVSPMRLRTTSSISRASFQPLRPMSLDGWTCQPRPTSNPHYALPTSLNLITEGDLDEVMSRPADTASSYVSIFTAESYSSTPPTTAATLPAPDFTKSTHEDENGTATIYLDTHLSEARYTPEDIDAPLPAYALDLFSRLDYNLDLNISDKLGRNSLPSPSRSSDRGPLQAKPKSRPAPSRHSSSFLEVPSFASPKKQDRRAPPSSSQRQLNALFSIPEALSSRIRVESGGKRTQAREGAVVSPTPSNSSFTSSMLSEEPKVDLTTKIKKRFSILRLKRS